MSAFRIVPAGDSALILEFEDRIDLAINARAVAVAEQLRAQPVAGVRDVVPTYRSVAVYFDPLQTSHDALVTRLEHEAAIKTHAESHPLPNDYRVHGVVRRREGHGDGAKVWVNFDRGGIKLLVLKFANLRPVAE